MDFLESVTVTDEDGVRPAEGRFRIWSIEPSHLFRTSTFGFRICTTGTCQL